MFFKNTNARIFFYKLLMFKNTIGMILCGAVFHFVWFARTLFDCIFQKRIYFKKIYTFLKKYFSYLFFFKKINFLFIIFDMANFFSFHFFLNCFLKKYPVLLSLKLDKFWFIYGFEIKRINKLHPVVVNLANFKTKSYIELWNSADFVFKFSRYSMFGFNLDSTFFGNDNFFCYDLYKHVSTRKSCFYNNNNENDRSIIDNFYFNNHTQKKILAGKFFFALGKCLKKCLFDWNVILIHSALNYTTSKEFWKYFLFFEIYTNKPFYFEKLRKIKLCANLIFRVSFFKFFYRL